MCGFDCSQKMDKWFNQFRNCICIPVGLVHRPPGLRCDIVTPISVPLFCVFSSHLFLSDLVYQILSRKEPFVTFGRNDLPVSNSFLKPSAATLEPAAIKALTSGRRLADYQTKVRKHSRFWFLGTICEVLKLACCVSG